jgi:hypothetical protein
MGISITQRHEGSSANLLGYALAGDLDAVKKGKNIIHPLLPIRLRVNLAQQGAELAVELLALLFGNLGLKTLSNRLCRLLSASLKRTLRIRLLFLKI